MEEQGVSTLDPGVVDLTTPTSFHHSSTTTETYIPNELVLPPEVDVVFLPLIVSTLCVGLLANALAVFITVKCAKESKENQLNIPGILVRALLATDMTASCFFFMRGFFIGVYKDTWIQCDLEMSTNLFFSWTSGLVNMLMSCDRCFALGTPFYYHVHATRFKAYITLGLAVLVAATLSLLPVFGFGTYKIHINGENHCLAPGDLNVSVTDFDFSFNMMFFSLGLGILLVIYAANSVVFRQLLKLRRGITVVGDSQPSEGLRSQSRLNGESSETSKIAAAPRRPDTGRREMRFGAMILVFSLIFSISWLPFYIQRLVMATTGITSHVVVAAVVYLLTLNHVIDPFVYVLMKVQYRKKLVQLGRKWRSLICKRCYGETASSERRGDLMSVSGAFYRDVRHSQGTTLTSSSITAYTSCRETSLQHNVQPLPPHQSAGTPLIEVTAASPSLVSITSQVPEHSIILEECSNCSDLE